MKRRKKKKQHESAKKKFVAAFCIIVLLFAAIRHFTNPNIPTNNRGKEEVEVKDVDMENAETLDRDMRTRTALSPRKMYGVPKKFNRVKGVYSWEECFPDINDVQLVAAQTNGISPARNREELEQLVEEHRLVNICHSPYYRVDNLSHSVPLLVPKAQHLLNTICLNFADSLQSKGLPLHLPIVTSVLRTADDVSRLRKGNGNATENSCHCYGTTVDITYNRFVPLVGYHDANIPLLRWDFPMKQVLAEVLRDLRQQGLCYVKHERKQACFHLTVR